MQLTQLMRPNIPFKQTTLWLRFHMDKTLFILLLLLIILGLIILYSASNENYKLLNHQIMRILLGFTALVTLAQVRPKNYFIWAPPFFLTCLSILIAVLIVGHIGKGAQRWLSFGFMHFQPSEIMKLALPLMLAWYLDNKPTPLSYKTLIISSTIVLIPTLMIAKQPDLGTALLLLACSTAILILANMSWQILITVVSGLLISAPILWHFLHRYQQQRILTFLDPERDPLGNGYHIIQSKIAIGSGTLFGQGWLHGTQSHLQFLPEHHTDFIFAVCGEEFGFLGCLLLISLYALITFRGMQIARLAPDMFTRLLASGISISFFLAAFINIGMVMGLLPVVGIPLPLISYGGSSIVITLASFGILMSIHTHRRILGH